MTSVRTQQATTERATVRSLTRGQITVLTLSAFVMVGVGLGGAIGTYANAASVIHRSKTALGVVAAGEGATLVAALVMVGVTMLGQTAPRFVRAALWVLPIAASVMGLAIAPTPREAVIYALTPLAMTAAAEGMSFLARRIVTYTSGVDIEAQRRNADILRQIAFHAAQAERHPDEKVRKDSELKAWKLMREIGDGDAQLGSGLISVQRERLTEGADTALLSMLTGPSEPPAPDHVSPAIEPAEPTREPTPANTVLLTRTSEPTGEPQTPELTDHRPIIERSDQQISREPVLSPAEPTLTKTAASVPEASETNNREPEPDTDETEQQIVTLAQKLKSGDRLTKTTAAELLGVSPATAGRRLKEARTRINDGTGLYL